MLTLNTGTCVAVVLAFTAVCVFVFHLGRASHPSVDAVNAARQFADDAMDDLNRACILAATCQEEVRALTVALADEKRTNARLRGAVRDLETLAGVS